MKVLNFMMFLGLDTDNYFECIKVLNDNNIKHKNACILDFYSQPFKPKMITELFEGWVLDKRDGTIVFFSDESISKDKNMIIFRKTSTSSTESIKDYVLCLDYDGRDWMPIKYPRTLDDFINDCQRAGIELKWKINN